MRKGLFDELNHFAPDDFQLELIDWEGDGQFEGWQLVVMSGSHFDGPRRWGQLVYDRDGSWMRSGSAVGDFDPEAALEDLMRLFR